MPDDICFICHFIFYGNFFEAQTEAEKQIWLDKGKIMQTQRTTDEFKNEPFTDYSKPENADAMRQAIEQVKSELERLDVIGSRRRNYDRRQS